jgi:hypothetical protein
MVPKSTDPNELAEFLVVCLKNVKDGDGNVIQVWSLDLSS